MAMRAEAKRKRAKAAHLLCAIVVGFVGFDAATAWSHHSDAGVYAEEPITLQAVVVEFRMINPHTLIFVDVADENGRTAHWQIETGSVAQLTRRGWDKNTLKPGDRITVTGLPARDGAHLLGDVSITITATGREILTRRPPATSGTPQ
jgi:hypothetical protein